MICGDCFHYAVCENITDPSMKNIVNGAEVEKHCGEFRNLCEIRGEAIAEIRRLTKLLDAKCDRCIARDRAEAIKEFAERLKERCLYETTDNINNPCVKILYDAEETIDDLVKEMTEGSEKK